MELRQVLSLTLHVYLARRWLASRRGVSAATDAVSSDRDGLSCRAVIVKGLTLPQTLYFKWGFAPIRRPAQSCEAKTDGCWTRLCAYAVFSGTGAFQLLNPKYISEMQVSLYFLPLCTVFTVSFTPLVLIFFPIFTSVGSSEYSPSRLTSNFVPSENSSVQ